VRSKALKRGGGTLYGRKERQRGKLGGKGRFSETLTKNLFVSELRGEKKRKKTSAVEISSGLRKKRGGDRR